MRMTRCFTQHFFLKTVLFRRAYLQYNKYILLILPIGFSELIYKIIHQEMSTNYMHKRQT